MSGECNICGGLHAEISCPNMGQSLAGAAIILAAHSFNQEAEAVATANEKIKAIEVVIQKIIEWDNTELDDQHDSFTALRPVIIELRALMDGKVNTSAQEEINKLEESLDDAESVMCCLAMQARFYPRDTPLLTPVIQHGNSTLTVAVLFLAEDWYVNRLDAEKRAEWEKRADEMRSKIGKDEK